MFVLPQLPYAYDALEPVMSRRTLHLHHDKHHAGYIRTVNDLLEKASTAPTTLESVVVEALRSDDRGLFNNAAQAWNHGFFWQSMSAIGPQPADGLARAIAEAFGDLGGLRKAFTGEGAAHFGSGWVWLTVDGGGVLRVTSTHDAGDMLTQPDTTPLLVCDLWEHAYYLDRQNDRKGFLESWFDILANWRFAAHQYAASRGEGELWLYPAALAHAEPGPV